MKVLLVAINAKYIHTNIAVRYLLQTGRKAVDEIDMREFTINHSVEYILSEIYKTQPEVICFSCYIWNMEMIEQLSQLLKKIMPQVTIILGGPEVSFESKNLMEQNDAIDITVMGEGEETFTNLLVLLNEYGDYSQLSGIAYRVKGQILVNELGCEAYDMKDIPFPYEGEVLDENKIVYYEASRGCPFNCQYCLSSSFQGVRFLPIERVKKELKYFIDQEVKQVKFVDRTFNANIEYALEIMKFLKEYHTGKTNFHFEVTADLISDEILDFLETVPVGLFQFEIGVQSTNEETLQAIQRKMDFQKLSYVVKRIARYRNIHQHLDLIAGLPKENYFTFRKSFNDVFALKPEKLQLGFLKLLKGSGLAHDAHKYGYIYTDYPPYEVLENDSLSYGEMNRLKGVEEMVEIYWNSGIFRTSVQVVIDNFYSSAFQLFEDLWKYWEGQGYHHNAQGKNQLYETLMGFYEFKGFEYEEKMLEVLKFDYLRNTKTSSLPKLFYRELPSGFKNQSHTFLQSIENLEKFLPRYINIPAKQIIKKVHFEQFSYNVVQLEGNPKALRELEVEKTTVLFDYDLENKALDDSKVFIVNIEA
ncbi:Radical SAM domain protein [Alkaliphilus metalliredigens QYMF]|uniref:Radical SAM domain protein n=1 Tax=Alkaliphilus metalliredigens (strain QYMF) TaxID=293826 RepID=A6TNY0_ALKMQ|nr:B12-binding domain-containing radical SAM protein [Alkaliphilus metalliredigens]ABR47898.1 Radical SAM domain protein [Alkaliphilus metalliredigens QYMF]